MEYLTGSLVPVWVSLTHSCSCCLQHFSADFIIQCISNIGPALFDFGNWGKHILTSYKGTCSFTKRRSIHVYIWYRRRKINSKDKTPLLAPVPGPLNLRSTDVSTDSFLVIWEHSANDIALYRLSWAPFTGGDTKEVSTTPPPRYWLLLRCWNLNICASYVGHFKWKS